MATIMERGILTSAISMKRDRDMSCVAEDLTVTTKKRPKKSAPSKLPSVGIVSNGPVVTKMESVTLTHSDLIVMDIQEPLSELKKLLEKRICVDLSSFQIWLQDKVKMHPQKSLSDQCIQSEGLAQIKLELKQLNGNNRINIIDVLKFSSEEDIDDDDIAVDVEDDVEDLSVAVRDNSTDDKEEVKSTQPAKWSIIENINSLFPIAIPNDPVLWTDLQVQHWLRWAMEEFQIEKVNESMWNMMGEQLCQMTLEEFQEKVPVDNNNLLWTHIELLRKCRIFAVVDKPCRKRSVTSLNFKPSQTSISKLPKARTSSSSSVSSNGTIAKRSLMTGHNGQIQLWQFLLELLGDRTKKNVIQWVGREGEFKLLEPEQVAGMWGKRKNKPKMNYEKLSRALRYYYSEDMIAKVHGRRFVYKFVCDLKQLIGYSSDELIAMVSEEDEDNDILLSDETL